MKGDHQIRQNKRALFKNRHFVKFDLSNVITHVINQKERKLL